MLKIYMQEIMKNLCIFVIFVLIVWNIYSVILIDSLCSPMGAQTTDSTGGAVNQLKSAEV